MAKRRILIIDDDVELCEGIAEFLRDEGFSVKNTSDTYVGQDLIEKHEFDVALLDYKITGLTGFDMLKKIRSRNSKTKVYLLTGRPFIEKLLEEEKLSHLVDGIIAKPFNANAFLEKIGDSCPR